MVTKWKGLEMDIFDEQLINRILLSSLSKATKANENKEPALEASWVMVFLMAEILRHLVDIKNKLEETEKISGK